MAMQVSGEHQVCTAVDGDVGIRISSDSLAMFRFYILFSVVLRHLLSEIVWFLIFSRKIRYCGRPYRDVDVIVIVIVITISIDTDHFPVLVFRCIDSATSIVVDRIR